MYPALAAPEGAAEAAALADPPEKLYLNPLVSHPVAKGAADGGAGSPLSPGSTIGSPSTSGPGSSSRQGGGGSGGGDRHLRRMTQSLVEILETISGSVVPGGKDVGAAPRRTVSSMVAARGDSVATMADLEGGRGGTSAAAAAAAAAVPSAPGVGEEEGGAVPAAHVRRLTTTLVDILRHVAATGPGRPRGASDGQGGSEICPEDGEALLGRDPSTRLLGPPSELSYGDTASLSSAATGACEDAATALLRAAFVKDEYRGDDVKPFYADARLVSAVSRRAEEMEEGAGALPADATDPAVAAADADAGVIPHRLRKARRVNWGGLAAYLFFIAAFIFYIYARAAHTLGLGGMLWYGAIVLAVEILGGLAMLPYGLCLTCRVTNNQVPPPDDKGQVRTALPYHLRVVVPCYKEPLEVIQKTVTAALVAPIPVNCARTVYLLDDGRDAEKKAFIRGLGVPNAVYVSGRKRAKGEMNGKSANINNAARQIYPPGQPVPLTEVMVVFDADQVPNADFFLKTVPLLDGGQDVGMVLSPQTFYNLNSGGDIFNHANVHFWDYTQPGYDALGLISCTGTNFLIRARAFVQAGLFPEWTLTEDFALGIELKKLNWQCRYVSEYLAIGEAPEEVRNCFQQRSRWSKGHFQTFFSSHNPVFAKGLSPLMRWMYGSVILSYFSAFTSTPLLMLVPMITVWLGAFPIVINWWAAIAITIYYTATLGVQYYTRSLAHLKSMWFSSVSNSILWFAFLKAMYRATLGRWLAGRITFKVTAKGLQRMADLPIRDIWVSLLFFLASLVCLIFGLVHFFRGPLDTPLAISLLFMLYNLVPQYLLLQYTAYRKPLVFNAVCKLAALLSTTLLVLGVVLVWLLYPRAYDYTEAINASVSFFSTQRVGFLPPANGTAAAPWRGPAFTADYNATVELAAGGFNASDPLAGFGLEGFDSFSDPFAGFAGRRLAQAAADPFGDPFAAVGGGTTTAGSAGDPFDPFATGPAAGDSLAANTTASVAEWDLGGGWMTGMGGGNIKATHPIAFATTLLCWSLMAFGRGFEAAGATAATLDSVRWGTDYLLKVHKTVPDANQSLLVTRVGDIDTEMMLWYRPEDAPPSLPRPAVAVDVAAGGGSELGGSVSAALAAASLLFRTQNDSEYAQRLLDKAQELYAVAKAPALKPGLAAAADFNLTLLYNASSLHDDLGWAAGWLYKATKQDAYLSDLYEHYTRHLEDEGATSAFKYAYDWDNSFYALNHLLAAETGRPTFRYKSEAFLRNWMCAGQTANFTARGRAYNPWSGSLGSTANAAALGLLYAGVVEREDPGRAREYRCFALGQVRYMLGDSGRSLVVGVGRKAPRRTQDRGAACPDPPEVCNLVTGKLSPDPDAHELRGALVHGSGKSDDFADDRSSASSQVGVELNAGLVAALAGVMELDAGAWEVCLQDYGVYRTSSVCGNYLSV